MRVGVNESQMDTHRAVSTAAREACPPAVVRPFLRQGECPVTLWEDTAHSNNNITGSVKLP